MSAVGGPRRQASYEDFEASVLFCNRCRVAQPVRERLLLVLPDGELHEYICSGCGGSSGTRKVQAQSPALTLG
jgi:hypothetical protein